MKNNYDIDEKQWSTAEVVKFGNYLLSEKRDGMTSETCKRAVTHADLANYEHSEGEAKQMLPSQHQPGEWVVLELEWGFIHCKVIKVAFTQGKVLYDVEYLGEDKRRYYNVDAVYVTKNTLPCMQGFNQNQGVPKTKKPATKMRGGFAEED